jgi:hypothetical protein
VPQKKKKAKPATTAKSTASALTTRSPSTQNIFGRFKREIDLLICTDDKKYETIRKRLTSATTGTTIVGVLSAYLANKFRVGVGVAATVVSSILLVFLQLGRNAYCNLP